MEKLIVKYLQKELSEPEAEELRLWLEESPSNRRSFENIVGLWSLNPSDIDYSKMKIWAKMEEVEETVVKRMHPSHFKGRARWRERIAVAALFLITLGASLWAVLYSDQFQSVVTNKHLVMLEKHAGFGQKLTFSLPDGSVVKLNSGSKIIYPEHFSGDKREVILEGEAFFDVKQDTIKRFFVRSGNVEVQVLGTAFNVHSYTDQENIMVAVKRGKVDVKPADQEAISLVASEMVVYNSGSGDVKTYDIHDERLVFGWIDKKLVFQDNHLDQVLTTISRWYNVSFNMKSKPESTKTFTGVYNNPTLNDVMSSLSYSYEFQYKIEENVVILY